MRFLTILLLAASSTLALAGTFTLKDKGGRRGRGCNLELENICGCKKRSVTVSESEKCHQLPSWRVYLKGEVCGGEWSLNVQDHSHKVRIDTRMACQMNCFLNGMTNGVKCTAKKY